MSNDVNIVNLINQLSEHLPFVDFDIEENRKIPENEMYLSKTVRGQSYFLVDWKGYVHIIGQTSDGLFYHTDDGDADAFKELFEIADDNRVSLLNLALIFSYFGPPVAVEIIQKAMGMRIDELTDALEDCRQDCADKNQSPVETLEDVIVVVQNPVLIQQKALKVVLGICACGLVVGYFLRKALR